MNAIDLLEGQHRQVEDLFDQLREAETPLEKERLFTELADKLAVHSTIEERHFYPSVKDKETEAILVESVEEHLSIKRILADLLDLDPSDDSFDPRIKMLREEVVHHLEGEEGELFPEVRKLMSEEELEAIGQDMAATQEELIAEGNPREHVPSETSAPAHI
jgi:hemerythrin superfamily protein